MELHHGQIIERVIRRNGYSISELARLTKVNRRSVYNWFNQKRLKPELIYRIGCVLNYDFSNELPDLFSKEDFNRFSHSHEVGSEAGKSGEPSEDHLYWKDKYIDLLERYNQLLMQYMESNSRIVVRKDGISSI